MGKINYSIQKLLDPITKKTATKKAIFVIDPKDWMLIGTPAMATRDFGCHRNLNLNPFKSLKTLEKSLFDFSAVKCNTSKI